MQLSGIRLGGMMIRIYSSKAEVFPPCHAAHFFSQCELPTSIVSITGGILLLPPSASLVLLTIERLVGL